MTNKRKFRVFYHGDFDNFENEIKITVAEIEGEYYSVIGNGNTFLVKNIKRDWGKSAKWGRYIKLP